MWKLEESKKYDKNNLKLSEYQIFEKAKEEIAPIQQNLIEKKITIDEAKQELKKINERLQKSNIEKNDKKEIWKTLKYTQRELSKLKSDIQWIHNRPLEVQEGIISSSKNFELILNDASQDKNPIAKWAWNIMKRLNS